MRFLLADDMKTPRLILKRIVVQDLGFEVVGEAENGLIALDLCRLLKPDAVIFDISMPVMSGGTAAKVVVEENLAKYVFIASSMAQDAIMKPLQDMGCIAVKKPFKPEKLVQEIRAAVGG